MRRAEFCEFCVSVAAHCPVCGHVRAQCVECASDSSLLASTDSLLPLSCWLNKNVEIRRSDKSGAEGFFFFLGSFDVGPSLTADTVHMSQIFEALYLGYSACVDV